MHIFNTSKVTTVGKKTPTNIIFYKHTILVLVIYSRGKKTVLIINSKCFEIKVKFNTLNKRNFF